MDVDARVHLPELPVDESIDTPHAWLHQHLGAIGRRLRTERNGIALHAGVVALDGDRGLLVLGSTGAGKSTLTALAADRLSGSIVTDDSAWLDDGTARGFGAPLAIRQSSPFYVRACAASSTPPEPRVLALPADLGIMPATTATITHVVVAGYGRSGAPCTELAPTALFAHLLGSLLQTADERATTELLNLAGTVPGHQLAYDSADASIEAVEAAWATGSRRFVGWHQVSRAELDGHGFGTSIEAARFGVDAALWHRATGQVVCLDGWPLGAEVPAALRRQLNSLGFMSVEAP